MVLRYVEIALGYLLYNFKAGENALILNQDPYKDLPKQIKVTSDEFKEGEHWPEICAGVGVGGNKCPSLSITCDVPEVKSLAVLCQDIGTPFVAITHMIAYAIDPKARKFELGEFAIGTTSSDYKLGKTIGGVLGYRGPRPITGHGPHEYIFQVFGLNEVATEALDQLETPPSTNELLKVIEGNVIATGILAGHYRRD
ncbi:hypothetical protein CLIB1423_01S05512 [[Candida] railenensis]|uniref:Phosphatidylethanolamine-binding protein n=1 Tax=[Candida] railenensis TaxID=45579 RepID=A0A9P0VW98_9ASCO|nr:hypothetical protein CLIB1423_01S05512 [[Candida] railenensis]